MRWAALAALAWALPCRAQQPVLSGQASAFVTSKLDSSAVTGAGLRYIPDFTLQRPLTGGDSLALDVSLDAVATGAFGSGPPAYDAELKPYRAWLRFATSRFETRVGLQKINFGSATLFRPLMWFDRVDPRDPLQLTNGVTGALARYYFPNNANVWGWALAGNTPPKGWETFPTGRGTVEVGGRVQTPVPAGELGLTYDRREADLRSIGGVGNTPEDRYGLDGKWNLGIGVWGEAALVHQRPPAGVPAYQRFWSVGADYTIGVGNGVYLLGEAARIDAPASPLGAGPGRDFSGLLASYPVGILDKVSAIVYRDWQGKQWYRIATWQRTYDAWTLYLLAFWNPAQPLGLGTGSESQALAGRGVQLVVAFNH